MLKKKNFAKALQELRKQEQAQRKQRSFDQTIDLIVNLKDFDLKKNAVNLVITLPHKVKDKKIAGFLEKKSEVIDTITKEEFDLFKDKNKLKNLVKGYDFFIASAKLMPAVATTFGRALGPVGKMPSPQIGILTNENEAGIKQLVDKIGSIVKVRSKEPSIKVSVGKQSSKDEDILENIVLIFNEIFKSFPKGKENLKSVLIKFTMSKPIKLRIE